MKKIQVSVILPLCMSVLFAGCSFEDIFSKLAVSDAELAATEAYRQDNIKATKEQQMNEKKQQFPEFTSLQNAAAATQFSALAYRKIATDSTQIDVEGILADPSPETYEVWLKGTDPKSFLRLGPLQFNQTDDYSLTYTTSNDIAGYNTVLISRDAAVGDKPKTIVMSGAFPSHSASSGINTK